MVEKSGAEVVKSALVVMHQHITLSTLVKCHCEIRLVSTGISKKHECSIKLTRFLILCHSVIFVLATFSFFSLF